MQVFDLGLPKSAITRIEKSIKNHLLNGEPEIRDGLCIFRFKPKTSLTEENTNQFKFRDEVWNEAVNSHAVIFDLSNVQYINEVIIGLLVGIEKDLGNVGVRFGLASLNEGVLDSLTTKGIHRKLSIKDSVDDLIGELSPAVTEKRELRSLFDEEHQPTPSTSRDIFEVLRLQREVRHLPEVISIDRADETITISFPSQVSLKEGDVSGLAQFSRHLLGLLGQSSKVVLNFANVNSIGSEVVTGLLDLNKRTQLSIKGLERGPLDKITTMKLHRVLNILDLNEQPV